MGDAPQAGFNAAQHNGPGLFEVAADQVGIGDHGPVRPPVVDPARGQVVAFPFFSRGRVIGDHGIHAPAGHPPEQGRLAQPGDVVSREVGLGNHPHPIADIGQHPADHGHAHRRGVNIGVPGDQDNVYRLPSQGMDLFRCCR